uniref:GATA zinc finger domain-containing protein 14-like n=1 Tax=Dermatophagoides pteronyssinus TaxID=6956 RepID=A0A6P6YH48_DERPT|nr:GATA zinc finger domain-containing protein 14-like [Dermatophagoides pteronyssinus]
MSITMLMCIRKCFSSVSIVWCLFLLSTTTYLCSAYYAEGIKGINKGKSYQSPSTSLLSTSPSSSPSSSSPSSSSSSTSSYGGITIKKPSSPSNYVQQRSSSQNLISTSTMGSKKMSPLEMMIFGPSDFKGGYGSSSSSGSNSFSSMNSGAGIGGSGSGYKSPMMTLSPFHSKLMDYGSGSSSSSSSLYGMKGGSGGIGGGGGYQHQQQQQQSHGPITAAVQTKHSVQYIDVPNNSPPIMPQTILVEANRIPLNIFFQSRSSNLNVETEHTPSPGSTQETSSEDEPHHLIHRVVKPIIQEVYEIIKPYRKITQEIKPVEENIQTIISRQIPSDNKYVPVNGGGQYKGGSQSTSPITIRPGSSFQQQAEMYQDSGSSFGDGSGGYQSSHLKPNTISYVQQREPTNNDADMFLNAIRHEVSRIKSQSKTNDYKTQSTGTTNSYIVPPISLNSIFDTSNEETSKKTISQNSEYSPEAIQAATYTLNPYHISTTRQASSESELENEHDDEQQINSSENNEPKIRSYRYQPSTNDNSEQTITTTTGSNTGRKLSDTSAYVTTLLPISSTSTTSENSPKSSTTTTTSSISSPSSESDNNDDDDRSTSSNINSDNLMMTSHSSPSSSTMENNVNDNNNNIDENNNNNNNENDDSIKETINSDGSEQSPNTIQSLMMYGNDGSLFVSQPSLTDSLLAQFEENSRLSNLKRMGYVSSIAHTNHYVTINDDDDDMNYGRRRHKRAHQ